MKLWNIQAETCGFKKIMNYPSTNMNTIWQKAVLKGGLSDIMELKAKNISLGISHWRAPQLPWITIVHSQRQILPGKLGGFGLDFNNGADKMKPSNRISGFNWMLTWMKYGTRLNLCTWEQRPKVIQPLWHRVYSRCRD